MVPSIWYENSPIVIQEALSAGIPVIASRIGGIPEKIKEGGNGFLFEPGDVEQLVNHLKYFLDNSNGPGYIRKSNHAVMSIQEHAEQLTVIYQELTCESYI